MAGRSRFTRPELGLIAVAASLVFTRVFAFSMVLPGFRAFGATLTDSSLLVGTALGAYGFTMAVMQLVMGELSDRFGRRPVLLAGSLLFVGGSVLAALASSIELLLVARLVQGLGGVSSAALAAVGETVPESRRTTAMAMVGIPAGLGFFLGFILAPFAEDLLGFRGLFWAIAVLGTLAVLPILARKLPAPIHVEAPTDRSLSRPAVSLAAAGFALSLTMSVVAFFIVDSKVGSGALAAILVVAFVAMGALSRLFDRVSSARLPIAALLVLVGVGAPLFDLTSWGAAVAGGAVFFAAHATLSAVLPSQVSRIAGRSGGRGHGIQLVLGSLGAALGGVLAGAMADAAWGAFAVAGSTLVAAAILVLLFLQRTGAVPGATNGVQTRK